MPIVHGDTVIPASSFNGDATVANLAVGSLCMDGLLMGTYHGDSDDNEVSWNNGLKTADAGINPSLLRKVAAYTGADLLGVSVRLIGAGSAFVGTVVQQFNTELDDVGGDGTQVPCLLIKAAQFYYVAEPASVEEE